MRIIDIRETSIALKSDLRNAVFDFSEMTTSVVAVVTDVVRDGKPVVGFAFNSTGRYACGAQMRARFIPRILAAKPEALLDAKGENIDPANVLEPEITAKVARSGSYRVVYGTATRTRGTAILYRIASGRALKVATAPITATGVVNQQSREITVAYNLSNIKLDGISNIVVQGANNARSSRR